MEFKENPYYSPELCGLEIFDEINQEDLCYEYNTLCIWKKLDDNTLWYDSDSGCSCPTPFEENRHDLRPIIVDNFYNFNQEIEEFPVTNLAKVEILKKVKDYLKIK